MAIEIEIDKKTGQEKRIVGGVVLLANLFNSYANGQAVADRVLVSYVQPGNQHVVVIQGRKGSKSFEVKSKPQPANLPLAEVVVRMADTVLASQGI